jgi:lipopolysaccharide export system permease protein
MKRIDRYIIGHVLGLTAIVALALLAIHTFVAFVAELDEAGTGAFGYAELAAYTLWLVPSGLYVLLPIIGMLGTLMGLGTLAAQSELTAMRASGVSLLRIGGATLGAGVLLGALCVYVGDWLAPQGQVAAESLQSEARSGVKAGRGGRSVWLREGEHIFLIHRLVAEDRIGAAQVFTLGPDLNVRAAMSVEDGTYEDGAWRLRGVKRTEFSGNGARVVELPELEWSGTLAPEVLRLLVLEADALSSYGLLRLIRYLRANGLDSRAHELALARKVMAPLTVMAMMLFAVPFVLGPLRNSGAGQRLLVGVLIGLAFYVINEVTANVGQLYGWNVLVSAGAPTMAFALIGLWRLTDSQ